jgi:predicted nucleic acid-binding protein
MILIDTNVLIYRSFVGSPFHTKAIHALASIAEREQPVTFYQTAFELWAVGTKPISAGGLGLTAKECSEEIGSFISVYEMIPDLPTLFRTWFRLVVEHNCCGRVSFDARLIAGMMSHGIEKILTFNTSDFQRFSGIEVLDASA